MRELQPLLPSVPGGPGKPRPGNPAQNNRRIKYNRDYMITNPQPSTASDDGVLGKHQPGSPLSPVDPGMPSTPACPFSPAGPGGPCKPGSPARQFHSNITLIQVLHQYQHLLIKVAF